MKDYEKCIHCDCFNADLGDAESHGQTIDACRLCEISEDELRDMAEWYIKHDRLSCVPPEEH